MREGPTLSLVISLTDRQAEWLEQETRGSSRPEGVEIHEKIERCRERLPVVIPGQLDLDDYPEVFSDAA
jgi:hypothetical protein